MWLARAGNLALQTSIAVVLFPTANVMAQQDWPAKQVRIVVPYAPGGAVDVVTRRVAQKLTEQTGKTFYVENKAGATGTMGSSEVARAAPDGYTLLANDTTYSLLSYTFKNLSFKPAEDLVPVTAFMFAPMAVVVRSDSKYRTLSDLLADAKSEKDKVTYGTGGAGTTPHFASEALGIATGAKFLHVPYKGAGEATVAMLGGQIDFQIASTPGVIGQVRGGKARLLAVSGDERSPALPDVPTFAQAGVKDYGVVNFTGLWAPKGTPEVVLKRLQQEVAKIMAAPDTKTYAESIAADASSIDAPAFAKMLESSAAVWGKVIKNTQFEKQ